MFYKENDLRNVNFLFSRGYRVTKVGVVYGFK